MATSADKDDRDDDKDDSAEADEESREAKKVDLDDEDDEDEKPAAKPAAKPATAKPGARPAVPAKGGAVAKRPVVAKAGAGGKPRAGTPPPKGSFSKSLILFVIVFGGLAAAFALLGSGDHAPGGGRPKWDIGKTVDVELTLVKNDQKDLACASADEVAGKHCAFEAQNKPWSKGDNADDQKLFKPYTTTDRIQFLAAGVWSDPSAPAATMPATRFSLKCKYKVEGTMKKVDVRWNPTDPWYPNADWYVGTVSGCKVVP